MRWRSFRPALTRRETNCTPLTSPATWPSRPDLEMITSVSSTVWGPHTDLAVPRPAHILTATSKRMSVTILILTLFGQYSICSERCLSSYRSHSPYSPNKSLSQGPPLFEGVPQDAGTRSFWIMSASRATARRSRNPGEAGCRSLLNSWNHVPAMRKTYWVVHSGRGKRRS
ncbi:hypothetical protein SAMN05444272_4268 [Roseibium suaedae]|uniref:Uncharacterized protein n=1 Tax=Roseibium suaedae TaxID=735517 RepID=A0A1M7PAK2_9HYPH|nr:hypothetical protein SAMN05444272_4268 [Roseibium suaedae]